MKILFKNVRTLEGGVNGSVNLLTDGKFISYIGKDTPCADKVIEGNGNLLMPAFYNAHCHSAMTLFRGYGDDLPLQKWLNEKIFPAEDRLNEERVYTGSLLAIAEMIRCGVVSFSDMYFFLDQTARAVEESGIKANLSRSIVSFDKDEDFSKNTRIKESLDVFNRWNGQADGRIKIDMSLHAEYTNVEPCFRYVAELTKELKTGFQIHVSETKSEHEECIQRHGMTPMRFLESCGVLELPVTAAHCVYVTDDDIRLMAERGVTAAHNPVSNLKLGSGIMPYAKMKAAGVNVALGTDGVASNNRLSVLRELQYAALIHKGAECDPAATSAHEMIKCATRNGAVAQGRDDCGEIREGMRADLILIDMDAVNNIPSYDLESTVAYSADESNVLMTLADGNILYDRGTYTTIDEELMKYNAKKVISHYFD
ncbi:MAG: amidohydrolase family protein [Eubacteriales bacterium]